MTDLSTLPERQLAVPYPLALDAVHREVSGGGLVPSPGGHVIASPAALPDAAPGPLRRFGLAVATAATGTAPPAAATGTPRPAAATGSPRPAAATGEHADLFADRLLDLHLGLLRDALRHAVEHLRNRTADGTSMLSKQLLQGQIADIAMLLSEEEAMPLDRRGADRLARWRAHQRLVALNRLLVRLLGASGFLLDGPAGDLHLAEVTGNVYLHPGGAPGAAGEDVDV